MTDELPSRVESIDGLLARNLVAARCALGWTQEALSAASGISRATIAQLETGYSDPRISTVEAIARAFGLTVALLLFGRSEIDAIAAAVKEGGAATGLTTTQFLRRLEVQLESNAVKDSARVAESIRESLQSNTTLNSTAGLLAAVLGAVRPDPGIAVGVAIGTRIHATGRRGPDIR